MNGKTPQIWVLVALFFIILPFIGMGWGFYAHQQINRLAVFTLPVEMMGFYKAHIRFLTESATSPDKRRYVDPDEAPRHYIDLDVYGDSAWYTLPRYWGQAVASYGEDSLRSYGIVPWHILTVKNYLTAAMKAQDGERILRHSADLGHYVADAHVPLHTTENYNGQLTGQSGIHGFWESRLPELFLHEYDFFVGKAGYIQNPQVAVWNAVSGAHLAVDTVLAIEQRVSQEVDGAKKYSIEDRMGRTVRVYSFDFSAAYHRELNGMVERQMRRAVKLTGDLWYTCWVDAGQPDLEALIAEDPLDSLLHLPHFLQLFRNHESGEPER